MQRRMEKPGKEREWRIWRQTNGQIIGSDAGGSEEAGIGCSFSLGSCDDGRLSTPKITENNDVNVFNNRLLNNSVNHNVHGLCKLVPEANGKVRTEVVDNISNVMKLQNDFNPEVRDSLRPNGKKDIGLRK